MDDFINKVIDRAADFLAKRPGLLPLVGVVLIALNFLLQFIPGAGNWVVDSNFFLHIGLVIGIVGLLLIRALG